MTTLKFVLSCEEHSKCLELLDAILNAKGIHASLVKAEIKNAKIVVTVFGNKVEALQTRYIIMRTYREWRRLITWKKYGKQLSLNTLIKAIGKPFPTDALVEVLKIMGSNTYVRSGILYTDASHDTVMKVAEELSTALERLVKIKPRASYSAKCLITALSVLQNKDVQEVLEELRNNELIKEEGHRLLATSEWRSLLRKLAGDGRGLAWK